MTPGRTALIALLALVSPATALVAETAAAGAPNPLAGKRLFLNPDTQAAADVRELRKEDPATADRLTAISDTPQAIWLTAGGRDTKQRVARAMKASRSAREVPVFVVYNIPARDCGSYSAGGARSNKAYLRFIRSVATTIGKRRAAVIMEPDAIAGLDCLSKTKQRARLALIKRSVRTLERRPKLAVYIDAGHSVWQPVKTMAKRLKSAGIAKAHGFALNVSNFNRTQDEVAFGARVSRATNGKHFVIDTSRNGQGPAPNHEWCNPPGRGLGENPRTTNLPSSKVDALLWIKAPGESDGTCNGGPSAGRWWRDYALGLIERAGG